MAAGQVVGAAAGGVRSQRFPEHELGPDELAAFVECQQVQANDPPWLSFGDSRHLRLPSGATFFPLPVAVSPVGLIGGVGLLVVGLSCIGMGIAAVVTQPGSSGLASGIVVGVLGVGMFVASVLLLRFTGRRYREQQRGAQPFGLYLLPWAVVLRLPPTSSAPGASGWCERYPRGQFDFEIWHAHGGAGTSSQASGGGQKYVRLRWFWPDGSPGERTLEWPVTGAGDELPMALRQWRSRPAPAPRA